jgi:Holliday junction DNA helicase RuvA
MIGKLKGIIDEINGDHIILDVAGVGYKVYLTNSTLISLNLGVHGSFSIEMYVREDQMLLYGFNSKLEQRWFNLLQTVQGVGARVSLSILSTLTPDQLFHAIISGDERMIKSIQGIGPKLAARIVNELRNHQELSGATFMTKPGVTIPSATSNDANVFNDALDAMANLGFARSEAMKVLSEITQANDNIGLEDLLKLALAKMASNR